MKAYKQQPTLSTFLAENKGASERDYRTMFEGDFKNHHRKIKSYFNFGFKK